MNSNFKTARIQWDEDNKLHFDPDVMQVSLDRAGLFYWSSTKGSSTTRAFITEKGKTAHLNESGTLATTAHFETCDIMRWISMNDGSNRKILVGFQGMGRKCYAIVQSWPLKEPGAKKGCWHDDSDMWHCRLYDSTCVIASFDERITNTAGCMAKANMNTVLQSSSVFFSKWMKTVDTLWLYADGKPAGGPDMLTKINLAFDSYVNRQRKEIARAYKGDKAGEIAGVEAMMHQTEPTRQALEAFAHDYDLPVLERVFFLDISKLDADEDAAEQALVMLRQSLT